ncbi:hypothetical protein [Endozoicomonas sp. ONNA2]|uniref:hypothetical protein n=1 Tax=Endozoicomonas sp. ONNA2 TaxID=2828741 RepID=UPI00214891F4|nr:hypothetical protein [Endozoicomonas sp. ONNA2]
MRIISQKQAIEKVINFTLKLQGMFTRGNEQKEVSIPLAKLEKALLEACNAGYEQAIRDTI